MNYEQIIKEIENYSSKSTINWLSNHTIYLTIHGSTAYGMNTKDSDLDIRGIAIPPKYYFFGNKKFEQTILKDPFDAVIFDIKKFIALATEFNPNAVEIIYTEPKFHVKTTTFSEILFDFKDAFLSKKAKYTMTGYAVAQLKRINTHRKWLLNPVENRPERKDFGLPDEKLINTNMYNEINAEIIKKLNAWEFDFEGISEEVKIGAKNKIHDILTEIGALNNKEFLAARSIGLDDNLLFRFTKEREYAKAVDNHKNYISWKTNRNPKRYAMEEKVGYDAKHASQLVRLYRTCIELLETGKFNVFREDSQELLHIKNGGWTYDQLMEYSEFAEKKTDELYISSKLPREPNRKRIEEGQIKLIEAFLYAQ